MAGQDRGLAVRKATRAWSGGVEISLADDIVLLEASDTVPDRTVRLDVINGVCCLSEASHGELLRILGNVEGVVPAGIERDSLGCIAVPGSEPDEVGTQRVAWSVGERTRLWCGDDEGIGIAIDQDGAGDAVDLTTDDAWSLACALAGARTWQFDYGRRQGEVGRDLRRAQARLRSARALVRGEAKGGRSALGTGRLMARVGAELLQLEQDWENVRQAEAALAGDPEDALLGGPGKRLERFTQLAARRRHLAEALGAAQLELAALAEAGAEYVTERRALADAGEK